MDLRRTLNMSEIEYYKSHYRLLYDTSPTLWLLTFGRREVMVRNVDGIIYD